MELVHLGAQHYLLGHRCRKTGPAAEGEGKRDLHTPWEAKLLQARSLLPQLFSDNNICHNYCAGLGMELQCSKPQSHIRGNIHQQKQFGSLAGWKEGMVQVQLMHSARGGLD